MADRSNATSGSTHAAAAGVPPLSTLVDAPLLQSMMDDFYQITHIPMSLFDLHGASLVGAGWQDACVMFHRANPESCANCTESDLVLTRDIAPGETRLYRCKNGMWDAAAPIMVKDSRVGTLFTGQFFFDDETVDEGYFGRQARRFGYDEDSYLAAIRAVPRLSRATVESGLRFLARLSEMISDLTFNTMERAQAEATVHHALREQQQLAENLTAERRILDQIIENTDTQLAYLDAEFRFVAVNDAWCRGSGCTRDELIGRSHLELFPDPNTDAIFLQARESREPVEHLERPFLFATQPWRPTTYWDWRLAPVLTNTGELQGFTLSAREVTRRVRQRAFNESINRLNNRMHANLDLDRILKGGTEELAVAAGCEVVIVAMRSAGGRWHIAGQSGLDPAVTALGFSDRAFPEAAPALEAGRPVSTVSQSRIPGILGRLGITTALVAPLSIGDDLTGALGFGYLSGPGEFDDLTVDFAGKIAASLSLALANARLLHDATHSSRLSGALAKINEVLLSVLTTRDVMNELVGEVSEMTGADQCLVIRTDGDLFTVTNVRNLPATLVGHARDASWYPAFALAGRERQPVLIGDTWNDPRTNKQFVVPNNIRAFQLLPLTTAGVVTHVLALSYSQPQVFDEDDLYSAKRMASAMSAALSNAQLYETQHRIADRLQEALLAMPDSVEGVTFGYAYHSASDISRVGGDFYDIFPLGDGRVGITIGDVAGKGLNAAVLTSLAKNSIRAHASESGKPVNRVLELTNDLVYGATSAESFVTLLFAVLDPRTGALVYANAGHPSAAILRADGSITRLAPSGPLLGAFAHVPFGDKAAALGTEDVLLLYTDGVTETRRADEFYGEERLFDFLAAVAERDVTLLIEEVIGDILTFSGGQLSDDLALLAVRRSG